MESLKKGRKKAEQQSSSDSNYSHYQIAGNLGNSKEKTEMEIIRFLGLLISRILFII